MNIFKKGLGLAVLLVGAVACSNDDVVDGVKQLKIRRYLCKYPNTTAKNGWSKKSCTTRGKVGR